MNIILTPKGDIEFTDGENVIVDIDGEGNLNVYGDFEA